MTGPYGLVPNRQDAGPKRGGRRLGCLALTLGHSQGEPSRAWDAAPPSDLGPSHDDKLLHAFVCGSILSILLNLLLQHPVKSPPFSFSFSASFSFSCCTSLLQPCFAAPSFQSLASVSFTSFDPAAPALPADPLTEDLEAPDLEGVRRETEDLSDLSGRLEGGRGLVRDNLCA